jgi:hypothetical protein
MRPLCRRGMARHYVCPGRPRPTAARNKGCRCASFTAARDPLRSRPRAGSSCAARRSLTGPMTQMRNRSGATGCTPQQEHADQSCGSVKRRHQVVGRERQEMQGKKKFELGGSNQELGRAPLCNRGRLVASNQQTGQHADHTESNRQLRDCRRRLDRESVCRSAVRMSKRERSSAMVGPRLATAPPPHPRDVSFDAKTTLAPWVC